MRDSSSYRGARRNLARRSGFLGWWRTSATYVIAANHKARLYDRAVMTNGAREAAAKAAVANHNGAPLAGVIHAAYVAFYASQKRTRAVARILRDLGSVKAA